MVYMLLKNGLVINLDNGTTMKKDILIEKGKIKEIKENITFEDKDLKIIDSPVDSSDIVMVSKKGSDSLTKKLNEALAGIKSNGKYKQAVDKWLKLGK